MYALIELDMQKFEGFTFSLLNNPITTHEVDVQGYKHSLISLYFIVQKIGVHSEWGVESRTSSTHPILDQKLFL